MLGILEFGALNTFFEVLDTLSYKPVGGTVRYDIEVEKLTSRVLARWSIPGYSNTTRTYKKCRQRPASTQCDPLFI